MPLENRLRSRSSMIYPCASPYGRRKHGKAEVSFLSGFDDELLRETLEESLQLDQDPLIVRSDVGGLVKLFETPVA